MLNMQTFVIIVKNYNNIVSCFVNVSYQRRKLHGNLTKLHKTKSKLWLLQDYNCIIIKFNFLNIR